VSEPTFVRVRVRSKTGDLYVRAGLLFRHDGWSSMEVPLDVALRLHEDPWLDVRDLAPDAPVDAPDASTGARLEKQLTEARVRIDQLEEELDRLKRLHAEELVQLREAHEAEISALTTKPSAKRDKRDT